PLAEPIHNRCQQVAGFLTPPSFGPKPGKVRGRSKLEMPGLLRSFRLDGFLEVLLRLDPIIRLHRSSQGGSNAVEFSVVPVGTATLSDLKSLADEAKSFTNEPRPAQ